MKDWELDGSKVRNGLTSLMANSYSSQLTKNATKQRSNIRCFHKQTSTSNLYLNLTQIFHERHIFVFAQTKSCALFVLAFGQRLKQVVDVILVYFDKRHVQHKTARKRFLNVVTSWSRFDVPCLMLSTPNPIFSAKPTFPRGSWQVFYANRGGSLHLCSVLFLTYNNI